MKPIGPPADSLRGGTRDQSTGGREGAAGLVTFEDVEIVG